MASINIAGMTLKMMNDEEIRKFRIFEDTKHLRCRYQHLVRDVLLRLPTDWEYGSEAFNDEIPDVSWGISLSEEVIEPSQGSVGLGSALMLEDPSDDGNQVWEITLYRKPLDRLSDEAIKWVIAHEFGHVASRIPCGSVIYGGRKYTRKKGTADTYEPVASTRDAENAADDIALSWGFEEERRIFDRELVRCDELFKSSKAQLDFLTLRGR